MKLSEVKAKGNPNFAEIDEVNLAKELKDGESKRFRLLGEVHPCFRYWITTRDGGVMPVIAKGFNPKTEEWDQDDPLAKIPDSENKRTEQFYVINAIDRDTNKVRILPLKPSILKELTALARNPDYGDPTDPVSGYDIIITKIKTGPKPQNVKYQVLPSRNNTPLTQDEQKLELFDLERIYSPRENYVEYIKEKSPILDFANLGDPIPEGEDEDIPL